MPRSWPAGAVPALTAVGERLLGPPHKPYLVAAAGPAAPAPSPQPSSQPCCWALPAQGYTPALLLGALGSLRPAPAAPAPALPRPGACLSLAVLGPSAAAAPTHRWAHRRRPCTAPRAHTCQPREGETGSSVWRQLRRRRGRASCCWGRRRRQLPLPLRPRWPKPQRTRRCGPICLPLPLLRAPRPRNSWRACVRRPMPSLRAWPALWPVRLGGEAALGADGFVLLHPVPARLPTCTLAAGLVQLPPGSPPSLSSPLHTQATVSLKPAPWAAAGTACWPCSAAGPPPSPAHLAPAWPLT